MQALYVIFIAAGLIGLLIWLSNRIAKKNAIAKQLAEESFKTQSGFIVANFVLKNISRRGEPTGNRR